MADANTHPAIAADQALAAELPADVFCQECGYNLRGLRADRCPECGCDVSTLRSTQSRIPWVHRRQTGLFRAYWKTVLWASFRYKRFCEEIVRSVAYRDAQAFRWVTILHVFVPVMLVTTLVPGLRLTHLARELDIDEQFPAWLFAVIMLAATGIALAAVTGIPSYFFEDRRISRARRNSAIAMSYYCCASLVWLCVPIGIAAFIPAGRWLGNYWGYLPVSLVVALPVWPISAWWLDLIHTARRVLPHRRRRAFLIGIFVPVLWVATLVFVYVLIPMGIGYAYLMLTIIE